jgi:hypothetical protein
MTMCSSTHHPFNEARRRAGLPPVSMRVLCTLGEDERVRQGLASHSHAPMEITDAVRNAPITLPDEST